MHRPTGSAAAEVDSANADTLSSRFRVAGFFVPTSMTAEVDPGTADPPPPRLARVIYARRWKIDELQFGLEIDATLARI